MALRGKDGKWLVGSLAKAADEAQYNFLMSTVPKQKAAARSLSDFGYAYVKVQSPKTEQKTDEEKEEATEVGDDASKPSSKTALKTIADPSKGFQWLGQKHYDGMGLAVIEDIYHRLEKDYSLGRVMVPLSAEEERDVVDHRIIPVVASTCTTAAPTAATSATDTTVATENISSTTAATASSSSVAVAAAPPASEQQTEKLKSKSSNKIKMARGVEPRVPIFMSPDALTADTLLLIMQGSGAVRPGMWARSVCFNDCLENGTIFPYLERAKARGWGVIVTNPNENTAASSVDDDGESPTAADAIAASELIETKGKSAANAKVKPSSSAEEFWFGTTDASWKAFAKSFDASLTPVRGSESPMDHSRYVYNTFITSKAAKAKHILIVAHSFGGICVGSLLRDDAAIRKDMYKKCRAVAFTDACNDVKSSDLSEMKTFYKNNVINWVASKRACDAPMGRHRYSGCEERSAGHDTHEWTSAACVEPVFKFLDRKLEVAVNGASN